MVSFSTEGSAPFGLDATFKSHPGPAIHSQNLCKRCQHPGCDLKILDCGCYLHARCTPVSENLSLASCPCCQLPARALFLMPMNFDAIDEAKAAAANMSPSAKRGKKRKNATIARLNPNNSSVEDSGDGSDLRTGRWTTEETAYCDKLIEHFEQGSLPISDGLKLNDFLANMLKSKQSRLTKKMKNARLSAKTYKRAIGFISRFEAAREFSQLERSFYDSIQCDMERAEIRFHMQKEWRELFSSYCVAMGQKLDADSWLSSVEEMDRRVSQAKDAARMARRKVMMGYALSQDSMNPPRGVFIENPASADSSRQEILSSHASSNSMTGLASSTQKRQRTTSVARSLKDFSSPFVGKVIQYMHRHQIPFEHIDAWVPSFVPNAEQIVPGQDQQNCRLCFAGFASTELQMPIEGGRPTPLSSQDHFDLLSFGEYSSKFSFDVGCGLPGRVYASGICSWEQGVANAPSHQFERCGGANQWGIKTVLGIPIPSPNVGRIVVLLYSRHDRKRDPEMVRRITEELTKLMPTPKWKLVVDVGAAAPRPENSKPVDRRISEVLKLMAEHVPTHRDSPYSPYLPGFTSLRLLLMKQTQSKEENELMDTILESYSSYLSSGRSNSETAWMIARDYMLLSQSSTVSTGGQHCQLQPQPAQQVQHQQIHQAPQPVQHQVHQQHQVQLPQQPLHQVQQQPSVQPRSHPAHQPQMLQMSHLQPQLQASNAAAALPPAGIGVLHQQSNLLHPGASLHQHQQKQVFGLSHSPLVPGPAIGGASQHQNGQAPTRQLAPSPGFSLQQSAFQPISHQQAHQQHNGI